MSNGKNNDTVIRVASLLNQKFKLIEIGRKLADPTSNLTLDFSNVDSLTYDQQKFIFLEWSNLNSSNRRNLNDFICEETVNDKLGEILNAIAREAHPFPRHFDINFILYWFREHKYIIFLVTIVSSIAPILGFSFWNFQKSYRVESPEIIVGTIFEPKDLQEFETYLEEKLTPNNFIDYLLGNKVNVSIEGEKDMSYKVAENKIKSKQWDIFFAASPILSIKSKDNQYLWGFKMFPENKSDTYTSGFFVRSDSKIEGINQINSSTTVALGEILQSASSFVVPVYELFGKTIRISTGHRGHEIVEMIKSGKADIGAAAITDNRVENNSELRLIFESRPIPGSGVYFSPNLSQNETVSLKRAMADAPMTLQLKAKYGVGQEPDYTEFKKIMEKVDEILVCADLSHKNVNLFCPKGFKPKILVGTVHGWKAEHENYVLFLKEENNGSTLNHIYINKKLFESIFEANNPQGLQEKKLKTMTPESKNAGNEVPTFFVKSSAQIEILD